jgi:hypothetical protein
LESEEGGGRRETLGTPAWIFTEKHFRRTDGHAIWVTSIFIRLSFEHYSD